MFHHQKNQQILAPMVRTGTLPLRKMALDYGADIVFSPEYVDRAVIGKRRRVVRDDLVVYEDDKGKQIFSIDPVNERGKLVFQLGSANPELALQAAQHVLQDVDGIDLNCGCPKPFSTIGGMGSHLLSNQKVLVEILRTLVDEITHGRGKNKPVSCKIRIVPGEDKSMQARYADTLDLVKRLEDTQISALTIHARLPSERYDIDAHQEVFRKVKEILSIPCYANGDIYTQADAERVIEDYGVDGVMFARGAQKNVSCFKRSGILDDPLEVATQYVKYTQYYQNPYQNSKFVIAPILATGGKHNKEMNRLVTQAKSTEDLCKALGMEYKEKVQDDVAYDHLFPYDPSVER